MPTKEQIDAAKLAKAAAASSEPTPARKLDTLPSETQAYALLVGVNKAESAIRKLREEIRTAPAHRRPPLGANLSAVKAEHKELLGQWRDATVAIAEAAVAAAETELAEIAPRFDTAQKEYVSRRTSGTDDVARGLGVQREEVLNGLAAARARIVTANNRVAAAQFVWHQREEFDAPRAVKPHGVVDENLPALLGAAAGG